MVENKKIFVKNFGSTKGLLDENYIIEIPICENDEERGYLKFQEKEWKYICNDYKEKKQITYEGKEKTGNLIILLESPHVTEFKDLSHPRPANGTTGRNIENNLKTVINHLANKKIDFIKKDLVYRVWIVNAVQYQCSCANALGKEKWYKEKWKNIRDEVFLKLWDKDNLNYRIDKISKDSNSGIILNCVTHGITKNVDLKDTVKESLDKEKSIIVDWYHPSSPWFWKKAK